MFTDTHCHLDFQTFDSDRQAVISAAIEAGVTRIINPGVNFDSSQKALRLADKYPEIYVAIGIHPNDVGDWRGLADLRQLVSHQKVVAVGEIGLDYYRQNTPVDVQKIAFQAQLDFAAEVGLPVILHNREASYDLLNILEAWHLELKSQGSELANRPGVLHSFSGSVEDASRAIQLGFDIGITGPVTFQNARRLQDIVRGLPLDRILIETDAPFLTPHPNRGKRNEPIMVRLIAKKIADLHQMPVNEVAMKTTKNAENLFFWREIV